MGRDGSGIFGCCEGVCAEDLHIEARKGMGNYVVCTRVVLYRDGNIMYSGDMQNITQEVHDVWTVGGASVYAMNNRLIITQKSNFTGGPVVTPHCGGQDSWGTVP